jgi:hypothetical protein
VEESLAFIGGELGFTAGWLAGTGIAALTVGTGGIAGLAIAFTFGVIGSITGSNLGASIGKWAW